MKCKSLVVIKTCSDEAEYCWNHFRYLCYRHWRLFGLQKLKVFVVCGAVLLWAKKSQIRGFHGSHHVEILLSTLKLPNLHVNLQSQLNICLEVMIGLVFPLLFFTWFDPL